MMKSYLDTLNLIDLISEKHAKLRKIVINTWIENGEEEITDTESYMLSIIQREKTTVAKIAKIIGISRQGAHKCAKGLISRGYIEVENSNIKSKEKYLLITDKGRRFNNETLKIKEKLEDEIIQVIGKEKFRIIKEVFGESWF